MQKRMSKKAQSLNINAVILIILGLIVMVFLILGFTIGWSSLFPWLNKDNAEVISQQCQLACTTASQYDFCSKTRDLKAGKIEIKNVNCNLLASGATVKTSAKDTTGVLLSQFGVQSCSSITCTDTISSDEIPYSDTDSCPAGAKHYYYVKDKEIRNCPTK